MKISLQEARQKVADYAMSDICGIVDCLSTPEFILSFPVEYQKELNEVMRYVFRNDSRPDDLRRTE